MESAHLSSARADVRKPTRKELSSQELQDCLEIVASRVQKLEGTMGSLECTIGNAQQLGYGSIIETIVATQVRIGRMDTLLNDKADKDHVKQMYQSLSNNTAEVASIRQTMSSWQDQMLQLEQSVKMKTTKKELEDALESFKSDSNAFARMQDMEQLASWVGTCQAQMQDLEASFKETTESLDTQQMSQAFSYLEDNLAAGKVAFQQLGKDVEDLEKTLQSKATVADMEEMKAVIGDQQRQLVDECAEMVKNCAGVQQLNELKAQIADVDEAVQGKIATFTAEESSDATAKYDKKFKKIEQAISQIEDAITAVAEGAGLVGTAGNAASQKATFGLSSNHTHPRGLGADNAHSQSLQLGIDALKSLDMKACSIEQDLQQKASLVQMQHMEASMKAVQAKLGGIEQIPTSDVQSINALKTQVKDLQQAVSEKASTSGSGDLRQLKDTVSTLQSQMAALGQFAQHAQSDNVSLDSVQQLKACILSMQAQSGTLQQELHDKAGMDQMQKLKMAVTSLQTHVAALEQGLQDKAGMEQVRQLNSALTGVVSKVSSLEHHKAENSSLHELNDTIAMLQTRVPTAERVQQLESTVTSLGRHINQIEQSKNGRNFNQDADAGGFANIHTQVELQHFKGIIAGMEKKVTDVEQDLQDKVSNGQIQQVRKLITGLDTKIIGVEQLVHEKAGLVQIQQVQGTLQAQLSTVELAVQEKISADQLHPLKGTVSSIQAQVANVEQTLHDKVGINQMQQLKGSISRAESKVCSLDQTIQEKADATNCQVQQLKDAVAGVQSKVAGIDQAVASRSHAICDVPQEVQCAPRHVEALDGLAARIKRLRGPAP